MKTWVTKKVNIKSGENWNFGKPVLIIPKKSCSGYYVIQFINVYNSTVVVSHELDLFLDSRCTKLLCRVCFNKQHIDNDIFSVEINTPLISYVFPIYGRLASSLDNYKISIFAFCISY